MNEARVNLALTAGFPSQSLEEPHIRELNMSAHQAASEHRRGCHCATDQWGAEPVCSVGREHGEAVTLPDAVGWVEGEQPDRARGDAVAIPDESDCRHVVIMNVKVRFGEDRLLVDEDLAADGEMVGELCRRGDLAAHDLGGCRARKGAYGR